MAARYALGPSGSAHENVQPSLRFSNPFKGVLIPPVRGRFLAQKSPPLGELFVIGGG